MKTFRSVMAGFAGVAEIDLGTEDRRPISRRQFREELRGLRRANRHIMLFVGSVLAALIGAWLYLAVSFAHDPKIISGVFAASGGLTVAGVMAWILRFWQRANRIGLFLSLVDILPEDQLRGIALILFCQWFRVSDGQLAKYVDERSSGAHPLCLDAAGDAATGDDAGEKREALPRRRDGRQDRPRRAVQKEAEHSRLAAEEVGSDGDGKSIARR